MVPKMTKSHASTKARKLQMGEKVRKSYEVVIYLQLNKDPFTHTEDITTAPSFTIMDENDNEDVNIED